MAEARKAYRIPHTKLFVRMRLAETIKTDLLKQVLVM
jgi:hypothetical protein